MDAFSDLHTDNETLSVMIGEIYDAALNPGLWPSVLEHLSGFVRATEANFMFHDFKRSANKFFTWGDDPEFTKLYIERYVQINPLFPAAMFFPGGEVFELTDIIGHADLQRTRFYKEYLVHRGWLDFLACNVEKTATSVASVAVVRHTRDGYVDDDMRRRMRFVAPHLRRAVAVGKLIDLNTVEAAQLADALDGLASGMFLVDHNARLIHANAAGCGLLDRGAVLRVIGGRMVANDKQAGQSLREALTAAAEGDIALGIKGIAIPLPGNEGIDHVAHILPLTSAARRRAGVSYGAVAAIFVHPVSLDLEPPLEAVSRRYGLTAGEVRVLVTLLNVGSVSEAAQTLGLSEGTVRNHLHHLFEKTGTQRQAELVRLVAGFAGPLVA